MKPIFLNLANGLLISILPDNQIATGTTCAFQLYAGHPKAEARELTDIANYLGFISFNWASQDFYYTAGNDVLNTKDIIQIVDVIKCTI